MKKILMVLLMVVSLFVVSSCEKEIGETNLNNSEQKSIEFEVAYDKKGGFGFKENNGGLTMYTFGIVSSVQELEDLSNEYNNSAFDESNESFSNELNVKIRSYNESFFNEKSLIIYSFYTNESKETKITNIKVDGNELTMNVQTTRKKGMFYDIAFNWIILIEINKVDVSNITDLKIVETEVDDNNSNNDEITEILKHFDLEDDKYIWDENQEYDYADDMVILTLKRTKTYPKLEIGDFGIKNIESIEYVGGELPPDYYFSDEYEGDGYYHQTVFVMLKIHGKDKVIEAIRAFDKLEFVRSAEPNSYGTYGVTTN